MNMRDTTSYMELRYLHEATFRCDEPGFQLLTTIPVGVHFPRDLCNSGIDLMLKCMADPVVVKVLIAPRASIRHLQLSTIRTFLSRAITAKSMPVPRFSSQGVHIRMKMCDTWIVDGFYHDQMLMSDFGDSWWRTPALLGCRSQMRLVVNSRTANPDRRLEDFVSTDDHGQRFAKIFLVLQLASWWWRWIRCQWPESDQGQE